MCSFTFKGQNRASRTLFSHSNLLGSSERVERYDSDDCSENISNISFDTTMDQDYLLDKPGTHTGKSVDIMSDLYNNISMSLVLENKGGIAIDHLGNNNNSFDFGVCSKLIFYKIIFKSK